MKIENGSSLPPTPDRLEQAAPASAGESAVRTPAGGAGADAVRVSTDAQLMAQAASRIGDIRDQHTIRPDVVERAKAALDAGRVGTDLDRLADRLIDGMLSE